jgi:hypothetical protein
MVADERGEGEGVGDERQYGGAIGEGQSDALHYCCAAYKSFSLLYVL